MLHALVFTVTFFVVVEEPYALPTVWVTVYTPGFGYVWEGFFTVALGVLSPKLYRHQVAPLLVSVTATLSGGFPLFGVMVNPAVGDFGVGVAVGVTVGLTVGVIVGVVVGVAVGVVADPAVTCFVVVDEPYALLTVWVTVYTPGLGYVWAGFFVVALGVLSPK